MTTKPHPHDERTKAQQRNHALHIYDVRGLTAEESLEAMQNIERIHGERFKRAAIEARNAARKNQ